MNAPPGDIGQGAAATTDASTEGPKRTAVANILVGAVRRVPSLLGLPAIAAASSRELGFVLWLALAVVAVAFLLSALRWWTFTYAIGDEDLVIQQGVLNRSRRSIPLERIQDVSIEQKLLQRLFCLGLVRIETGGGVKDEGTLDSVTLAEAHRIRATLRGDVARVRTADDGEDAQPEDALTPIFAMGLGRVLFSGLFNFSLVWLAAIAGLLQTFDDWIDWRGVLNILVGQVEAHRDPGSIAALVAVALVLGSVAGVLRTLARDFGFTLTHGEGRFRRVRGLLTRSEVVIATRRIQLGVVRRGAVAGRLGWSRIDFQTLGGSDDVGGRQQVAPFARRDEIARVIAAAALPSFERMALRKVSAGHILRALIRHAAPLAIGAGIAGIFFPPLWLALLLLPLPVGLALLRRRCHRYALCEASLQVTRGVLVRRDWTVPYGAVQVVAVRRGPLQRMLGIASVAVDSAGAKGIHRPDVVDLAEADAVALASGLIARA